MLKRYLLLARLTKKNREIFPDAIKEILSYKDSILISWVFVMVATLLQLFFCFLFLKKTHFNLDQFEFSTFLYNWNIEYLFSSLKVASPLSYLTESNQIESDLLSALFPPLLLALYLSNLLFTLLFYPFFTALKIFILDRFFHLILPFTESYKQIQNRYYSQSGELILNYPSVLSPPESERIERFHYWIKRSVEVMLSRTLTSHLFLPIPIIGGIMQKVMAFNYLILELKYRLRLKKREIFFSFLIIILLGIILITFFTILLLSLFILLLNLF